MTKTLRVELGDNSYPLVVGTGLLNSVGERLTPHTKSNKVLIVSDTFLKARYMPVVLKSLEDVGLDVSTITVPAGDENKSLTQFSYIQDSLVAHQLDRGSTLIALGGGVIGDLAGFAAAVYMRGIPYVQIPTTLQAQVDASVGGKTAINHPKGKNLIGAFHQPKLVLIDVDTLKTLPQRDIRSGLIEVIKMGVIRDEPLFERVEENLDAILNLDNTVLTEIISQACINKAEIVAKDEKESGLRMVLNYGHTFGHALEALTHYNRYRHGEAVSIGMNCAAQLAVNLGMFSETDFQRQQTLLKRAKLPIAFPPDLTPEALCDAMYLDKKTLGGKLRLILPTRIGEVVIRDDVDDRHVLEAISQCF
ncbi:MAG: 3-dehydroquinate synthase, partial [Candidatus Poribacteria bacterium]|nr:3-dehydroquinate synthase [Candidatus Poribacteria bacterium]